MIHTLLLVLITICLTLTQGLLFSLPVVGIIATGFCVLFFYLLAIYDVYDLYAEDTLTLSAVIPAITLFTTALELQHSLVHTAVTYATLLFLSGGYTIFLYIKHGIFAWRWSNYIPFILPLGIGVGLLLQSLIPTHPPIANTPELLIYGLLVLIAIAETLFFQALVQNAVELMTEQMLAILFTSLLYTIFHATNIMYINFMFFGVSVILASTYSFIRNIYVICALNLVIQVTFYLFIHRVLAMPL
jgi:hypothetical protein